MTAATAPQGVFAAAVLTPQAAPPPGLRDGKGRQAGKRFDVYRNNVAAGMSDALETAFPTLRALLGADYFRALAGVYLRAHPPRSPLMMFCGDEMPAFLDAFPPVRAIGYLPDIARLEIAMRAAYHAADAAPVAADAPAALAPDALETARLRFAPAVRLLRSDWPLHAIWRRATDPGAPALPRRAEAVLITRPDFDPQVHPLTPEEAEAVAALLAGQPLGPAMAPLGDSGTVATLLRLLLAQGAITAIT